MTISRFLYFMVGMLCLLAAPNALAVDTQGKSPVDGLPPHNRMAKLASAVTLAIVEEFGPAEALKPSPPSASDRADWQTLAGLWR